MYCILPQVLSRGWLQAKAMQKSLTVVFFVIAVFYALLIMIGWFVGVYGISTFVGYLTPNPFLCK